MSTIEAVDLDISVVLGRARMPIHMLLKMGRGAVITLDTTEKDEVEILANDHPVAKGIVVVDGADIAVEVVSLVKRVVTETTAGASIAAGLAPASAA
ncbi:MAG: FliM/FliN family flagellar motor switch protein [Beijerinckiaceae bacterium]